MEEGRLAYLAGFFDGEGTVGIRHRKEISGYNGKKYENWRLAVAVGNHCGKPIKRFKKMFGGNISRGRTKTSCKYLWSAQGFVASAALLAMLPYLSVKKKQAILAIKFQQRLKNTYKPQAGLSKKERAIREEMRFEIRRLNARYSKSAKNRLIREGVSYVCTDHQKPWDENSRIGRRSQSPSSN